MKHFNITIFGNVQGVGYRYSAMKMARAYDISGFVRNQANGSVYMEAEGNEANMALFLDWCGKGPGFGRVERIIKVESGFRGFQEFSIENPPRFFSEDPGRK